MTVVSCSILYFWFTLANVHPPALCTVRVNLPSGRFSIPGFDGSTGVSSGIEGPGEEKTASLSETLPPPYNGAAGSTSAVAPPLAPA